MEEGKIRLNELLEEARAFVYFQVGDKSPRGNLLNLTPSWTRFTIRTDALIQQLFGREAEVYKHVHAALKLPLVGNGESNFLQVRNMLEGAISAAIALLEDLPQQSGRANSPGPLSNRIFIVHGSDHVAKTELERFIF